MTEDEKELEQKIKQYQYEAEEAKKKIEIIHNDMDKKSKKKSFIYKLSHAVGNVVMVWAGLGFVIFGLLLIFAVYNYVHELSKFDIVKQVEMKYELNLQQISREAGDKKIVYNVKPTKWKYRKIEFIILQDGGNIRTDDFQERYLKHIIDKMKDKQLIEGFQIIENYKEYNMLEYKLVYKNAGENENAINQKLENLKAYVKNKDKKGLIKNIDQMIIKTLPDQNANMERLRLISQSFLFKY